MIAPMNPIPPGLEEVREVAKRLSRKAKLFVLSGGRTVPVRLLQELFDADLIEITPTPLGLAVREYLLGPAAQPQEEAKL